MTSPKVSICVPTYNYARFLPENIESILKQSFDDFELIIIDDCSNDNTKEVVNRYASCDNRIKFKINSCNVGMVQNWNLCLREAKGTYIKYVFGDDFLTDKDSLKKLLEAMESHPEVSLVSSARYIVDENSKVMGTWSYFKDRDLMEGTKVINRCLLRGENLVGEPSVVLFKRNQANRGFNEKYAQWVDLEMWFHLLEQGLFAYSDEPLSAFRIHPQQQTEKKKANAATFFDAFYLCGEYLHRPYITVNNFVKSYIQFKYSYQIWKAYKKGNISKHLAFEKIKYRYSIIEFWFLFCLYKICRPFENIVEHFRKVQFKNIRE